MSGNPFQRPRDLLADPLGPMARLVAASRRRQRAEEALSSWLGGPANEHVTVANLTERTVVLQADSPAWSARVRYQSPQILAHLRERLDAPALASVKLITRPPELVPSVPARRMRLTRGAAQMLESVAAAAPERLRETLLRIARHAD